MAEIVQDCLRCGAKSITFDIMGDSPEKCPDSSFKFEVLVRCRQCEYCSIAVLSTNGPVNGEYRAGSISGVQGALNFLKFENFLTLANNVSIAPPEHLPDNVARCFQEGAASFSIGAYNAAAAMFRLSLDLATKGILPATAADQGGPNSSQRKRLYDRLEYLFDKGILPAELRDLADCVREDGNDGAHDGTLRKEDAEDLIDFSEQLLERVYTEPARLKIARARRDERRAAARN